MATLEQVQKLIGFEYPPITFTYTARDVSLYALGVGAPADTLDQDELQFVYELSGKGFKVLPSFPVIFTARGMIDYLVSGKIGDIDYNPMMLVHGEQYLELKQPLPTAATITSRPRITAVYDKGSGMVVATETASCDEQGREVAVTQSSMFIRGLGGFGGERGPSGDINTPPDRAPDVVHEEKTLDRQALIYRLSGDINPLHADPAMAAMGNFEKPILHGLATFGFATRAILKRLCGNDPARFQSIRVRFSKHVFPGETLVTEMWKMSDTEVIFRCSAKERAAVVLSNAVAHIR